MTAPIIAQTEPGVPLALPTTPPGIKRLPNLQLFAMAADLPIVIDHPSIERVLPGGVNPHIIDIGSPPMLPSGSVKPDQETVIKKQHQHKHQRYDREHKADQKHSIGHFPCPTFLNSIKISDTLSHPAPTVAQNLLQLNFQKKQHKQILSMVQFPNTTPNPPTVMVKFPHARLAHVAVFCPRPHILTTPIT